MIKCIAAFTLDRGRNEHAKRVRKYSNEENKYSTIFRPMRSLTGFLSDRFILNMFRGKNKI